MSFALQKAIVDFYRLIQAIPNDTKKCTKKIGRLSDQKIDSPKSKRIVDLLTH